MARKDRDLCPVSIREKAPKSILTDPSYFRGEPATPANMMRCVLYEAFGLAAAVQLLKMANWSGESCYDHPCLGRFDPSEIIKRSALISFRILYDFLYIADSHDDFQLQDFQSFGVAQKDYPLPSFDGFEQGAAYTRDSVDKYIAHLTWTRITKSKRIPQPRFSNGTAAIIANGLLILSDAERFADTVIKHPDFPALAGDASGYLDMFRQAQERIATIAM